VTQIGQSAIGRTTGQTTVSQTTTGTAAEEAKDFKVVVTLQDPPAGLRPGLSTTAKITTATRQKAIAVPIQAMTLREVVVDDKGQMVPAETPAPGATSSAASRRPIGPAELKPGQERKELEGVFIVKDGRAAFVPVKTGIAGEKYFEVLSGLKVGDEVITGPFASVRSLRDGAEVKTTTATPTPGATAK